MDSQRSARRIVLVLICVFAATLPAVTPRIYASDEIEYFAFLRSAWFDRDFSFDNEYRHFRDAGIARSPLFRGTFLERATPTGMRENFATIGCALLWAPFYLVADLVARSGAGGETWPADGYSPPYVAAVAYGSAIYGFLSLVAGWWIARALAGGDPGRAGWRRQALAVLAVWFGTPLLFYMYIAPPMSHACSAFAVSAFVLGWLHVRRRWSVAGCAGLGALAALMTMVREQDAFFAVGPALDYAWTLASSAGARDAGGRRGSEKLPRTWTMIAGAAAGVAAFAVVFLPQAIAYLTINGRMLPSDIVQRKMVWHAPHAWSVLASPEHGLFAWTPLALLGIAGLVMLVLREPRHGSGGDEGAARSDPDQRRPLLDPTVPDRDRRRVAVALVAMVAAQAYIAGSVGTWTVAGAFGQRRFVALTALLVVGLTALAGWANSPRRRAALVLTGLLCVWWNVGLLVQFGAGMMDRQRLELGRNAYTTFVELPLRLPTLAYRYMFDRASFYGGAERRTTPLQGEPR